MPHVSRDFDDSTSSASQTAHPSHSPLMRTVLSQFCDEFDNDFRPILEPVQRAAEALAAAPEEIPARHVLPSLRNLGHEMKTLIDKVAEQQAYVLIFGPLKSGKSTFMNALSATYVSEVTSLPAYPCMVYVSHADTPGFVVSHYDGRTATFTQREALHEVVADAHRRLTRKIREVEADGGTFDPAVHMPDAIRKVDVKITIPDLQRSGAVLVDTPGLYSRMKFGYDRMTRDFRNAAACAIFIVKTDNLFLEQVFDEFNELLQLFSRIFLVVNLDSTKKDLLPDGTLAPSLEHENPWEIIEAFEDLSMTAPLKEAADDGRLSIYPVDLLSAASRRIMAGSGLADLQEAEQAGGQADFDTLLQDLGDFLNSNEYLKAFLGDSLRRSRALTDELRTALQDESVHRLGQDVEALRAERGAARTKAETIERLRTVQWRDHVQGLAPWLIERVARLARQVKADAAGPVGTAVDQWFESGHSLHHLLEQDLLPIFASSQGRLVRDAEDALKRRASEDLAGLSATEDLLADLRSVDIEMAKTAEAALGGLKAGATVPSPRPELAVELIPVRRSFADWCLFRSGLSVRRRLFGPAEKPDEEIEPDVKVARLGPPARESMHESMLAQLDAMIDRIAGELPEQLVRGYAERFEQDLQAQLERAQAKAKQQLEGIEKRLSETERANESLGTLTANLDTVSTSLRDLTARFGETDTATLTQQVL
jgi:hypothetical protein